MKTQARHKLLEGGSGGGDDGDRLKNRPVSARTARILMVGGDADKKKKDGQVRLMVLGLGGVVYGI